MTGVKPWQCHDRPPYIAGDTVHGISKQTGLPVSTYIPFRMARDCQYTLSEAGQADKRCSGCKWKTKKDSP